MSAASPETLDSAALFRQYAGFVARFLTRLGVASGDLDDVLQEVFLVVHARGGYVAGPAKPTSYLGAVATRAASSYRRRRGTSSLRTAAETPDELRHEGPDPVQSLQRGESARALSQALAELDPVLCATLLLVDQEGESCASVAASMAAPVGTVYWRLHKARKLLRHALSTQDERPRAARPLSKEAR